MGGQYVQTGPPIQVNLGQNTGWNLKLKNYYNSYTSSFANFTGYTLPGPPTSFSATALSDTEIQLAWTAPSKGSTYLSQTYTIQRKLSGGSYSNIATGQTGASYTDSGLTQGTQYYYKIKTTTTAGSSTYATEDNATTQTGPDPVAGDALGLGALGYAVGINGNATSQTSISACNGGGTSEVKMSDYYCGSVGNLTGDMFIDPNQTTTFTANFNNRGSKFNSRIGIEDGNFTWTSDNTGVATVEGSADRTCVITGGSSVGSTTIRMTFAGRYNTHSSIPSTQKTRTIVVTNMP
jgi:hypothetical protein